MVQLSHLYMTTGKTIALILGSASFTKGIGMERGLGVEERERRLFLAF